MLSKYLVPVEKEKDSAFDFSIDQAQKLMGKGVEVAGRFTGIEGMEQFGSDIVTQQESDIEEGGYTPEYQGSLREAYKQGGVENALGWLKEKSIENAVSSGTAIVGTGLAAITAPFSIPASLAITGATIGSSVLMGAGESAQEMEDKTGTYDANVAVGVGAIVGILDKFGAGKVIPKGKLSNMTGEELITALAKAGKPDAGKAIAARIGKATAGEAGTEALQESAIMGGAALTGGEYTGIEIADKIIDSAALGGTMGGATRGAGELVNVAGRVSPSSVVDKAKGQMEDIFRGPDDTSGLALAGDVPSGALQQQQEDETTAKAQIDEMMIGEGTVSGDEGAKQWREKAKELYTQSMSDIQEDADINVLESDYRLFQNLKDEDKRSIFKETGAYVDEIDGQIKTEIPSYNAKLDQTVLNDEQFFKRSRALTGGGIPYDSGQDRFTLKTVVDQANYLGINPFTDEMPKLKIRDMLKFPEFYKEYDKEMVGMYGVTYQPIGDIPIKLETNPMAGGSYDPTNDVIRLAPADSAFIEDTLLHELQHAIQHRHGFAQGDSPSRYLPENMNVVKEKIKYEIKRGTGGVIDSIRFSPLTREKYREYKDTTKYTPEEIKERLQTIIYALANRTVSQPFGDASMVSKDLANKKMPKVLPTTIDGPAISYSIEQAYEDSVDDLQKLYDIFSPSDKIRYLQKFVNLSVLNHRMDTAEQIASLTYRLASGELESRNVENRHRIALEKYIKEGKNPDKALRELYPTDTRGLPKSFVNYFRSPQYKNISKLGQFTDEELLGSDQSEGLGLIGRASREKILKLNSALSFDTESVNEFIAGVKAPEDKIRQLRINMALRLAQLDKLESVFVGKSSTVDKPITEKDGVTTNTDRTNFSRVIMELSARYNPDYEFYNEDDLISIPAFSQPVKTQAEERQRLEQNDELMGSFQTEAVGKIVFEVKEKLLNSGLANITTEIEKVIASFYLGYPIRVGFEPESVIPLGIKRPTDVPSDAQPAMIVAPNSIINKKIKEFKSLPKDKKTKKETEISEKINYSYITDLEENKNKNDDIFEFRYTAPLHLDELAFLYNEIQDIKKGSSKDITTTTDIYGMPIEKSMVGYPVTEEDIDSRTMFINDEMKAVNTQFSEAKQETTSDTEQALEMLKNPDAISKWKKDNKVSKEELKRRTTRKYIEQTEALQQNKMSGKEYRDFIRTNQPATKFEAEDLSNLFASYTDAVGALKPSFSAKGIVGLTTEIPEGTIVDSRLDIDGYNLYNTWIASIKTPDGNRYGRTAVLKDVKFSVSGKNPVDKTLAVAQGKAEKSPFAVMKGEWQNLSDEEAYSLAETYINNPDYVQVGFNPERHSFFYRKDTMMPVFEAEEVVQVGALVLAKLKKEDPVERIGKLKKLRIKSRQGDRPATFNEGGIPMKKDIQAQQLELFGDVGKMAKKSMSNDPVSGNEIPKGSVAEEVRDDIPAQLSEGEFVLPADVVRYHGLEKLMKLRQEAKGGINMMDNMGQMGNSEEATMPDNMPFKPQMAVGGAVPGVNIAQPTTQMMKPSIYSTPNVQPVVTPQVAVPTQPTYTAQTMPQYQQQPTNTAATPTFGGLVGAPFGQLQESTTKKYVNSETGEELYIPFVNGKPVYPIPTGFKEESEIIKEEEKKDPVASQTKTTQVTNSGGSDNNESMQTPQTKEYQVASALSKLSYKEPSVLGKILEFITPGIQVAKLASELLGQEEKDKYDELGNLIDSRSVAENFMSPQMDTVMGDQGKNEELARASGYTSYADMQNQLGASPNFKNIFGTDPGQMNKQTGRFYNDSGQSSNDDGTVSFSSFGDFVDNMKASVKSGWHGGAGYTKSQFDSLSDKAKDNYKNHITALNEVKGKDITPSYLKTTIDPSVKEVKDPTLITNIKENREKKELQQQIKEAEIKKQNDLRRENILTQQRAEDKARKQRDARAVIEKANRERGNVDSGGGSTSAPGGLNDSSKDFDTSSYTNNDSGDGDSSYGDSTGADVGGWTAKGGLIDRRKIIMHKGPPKKKMKQGGLASRR